MPRIRPAALLIVALLLAGCGTEPDVTAGQIAGVWTNPDGGRLELVADGTFVAADLLGEAVSSTEGRRRISGSGDWRIGPDTYDPDGPVDTVYLSWRRGDLEAFGANMWAEVRNDATVLVSPIDRPDLQNRYELTRQ